MRTIKRFSAFNVAWSIHPFLPGIHEACTRSLAGLHARAHAGAGMPSEHGVRHESHTVRTVIHGVRVLLLQCSALIAQKEWGAKRCVRQGYVEGGS